MRETWKGLFGVGIESARLQAWVCRLLMRSGFLRSRFRRNPFSADIVASWDGPEGLFTHIDERQSGRIDTLDLFSELVSIHGMRVLDLGCGQAGLTCRYAIAGALHVVGFDRNYEVWPLTNAKGYIEHKSLSDKVRLVQGDGARVPFEDCSFDLIVSNNVFDHIIELENALEECYRVLEPGGRVVITFIPWYHPGGFHLMDYISIPYANLFFSEKALLDLLMDMASEDPRIADSIPGLKQNPPPASFDDMGIVLSRVTIRRFRRVLQRTAFNIVYFELVGFGQKLENPVLGRIFDSLTKIPFINELFTSRIDCVLEKPAVGQ